MNSVDQTASLRRRFVVALVLTHLIAVLAMAASPSLHHWIHQDADHDDDCAVVVYLSGRCEGPPAPVLVAAPLLGELPSAAPAPTRAIWVESIFSTNRVYEHAPPATA